MRQKSLLLLLLLLGFSLEIIAQSGWTRPKDGLFLKTDFIFFKANQYFNPLGNQLETNTFTQLSWAFYGEYGIKDRLTLISSAPLLRMNKYETTRPVFGQGDLQVHLKYRFTNNTWPVAFSLGIESPTGRANAFAQDKELPGVSINLPTGDGEFNFWAILAASRSFGKGYATVYGAYNKRTAFEGLRFRDLYQLGGEIGIQPIQNLWLNAKIRTQLSNGKSQHPALSFVRGDASTFMMLTGEAFYKPLKHWGWSITYSTASNALVPYRNIYAAPVLAIGMAYER